MSNRICEEIAAKWSNAVLENPKEVLETLNPVARELGVPRDDGSWAVALSPVVYSKDVIDRALGAAEGVSKALKATLDRVVADAELRHKYLGLTADPYLAVSNSELWVLVGRFDGFLSAEGDVRFVEYNSDPFGALVQTSKVLKAQTHFAQVSKEHDVELDTDLLPDISAAFDARHRRPDGSIPIIGQLLEPTDPVFKYPVVLAELKRFETTYVEAGGEWVNGRASEFSSRPDGFFCRDKKIDILHVQDYTTLSKRPDVVSLLIDGFTKGTITLPQDPASTILSANKSLFAMVCTDEVYSKFDKDTQQTLRRHVPWTQNFREGKGDRWGEPVDLVETAQRNRESLVLKPTDDYGGAGVVLGWELTDSEWEQAIKKALSTPHVIQERVELPRTKHAVVEPGGGVVERELTVDFCPFVVGFSGSSHALHRGGPSGPINISTGGALIPSLQVTI